MTASETSLQGVVAGGRLQGFSHQFAAQLTLLLEAGPEDGRLSSSGWILRLLAGVAQPSAGAVRVHGRDPALDPALRRRIALLGDPAFLDDEPADLAEAAYAIAAARGVSAALVASLLPKAQDDTGRRRLADALAHPEQAELVLASFPERQGAGRDEALAPVRAALARGVAVVVATRSLDDVLAFAPDERAVAVLVAGGVAAAVAPAHALPWAASSDGARPRIVRVVVGEGCAARLASQLLTDEVAGPTFAAVEVVTADELLLHTRDPRAVARAVSARAKAGVPVRALSVYGASAAELIGAAR